MTRKRDSIGMTTTPVGVWAIYDEYVSGTLRSNRNQVCSHCLKDFYGHISGINEGLVFGLSVHVFSCIIIIGSTRESMNKYIDMNGMKHCPIIKIGLVQEILLMYSGNPDVHLEVNGTWLLLDD